MLHTVTPPSSSPPPPEPATHFPSTSKKTRKATQQLGVERPLVHVDPTTGDRDKVDDTYDNWKQEDSAEFDIPEAFDLRKKKKILQTIDLTSKWALADHTEGEDDKVREKYDISKEKWNWFCQSYIDPSWEMTHEVEDGPHKKIWSNDCKTHWQMVVICPKDNVVIWFCSLHNMPDNYLKEITNIQQSKSKPAARWIVVKCNKQKGSIECGYYVMHWMSMIVLGGFKDNWKTIIAYFKTNSICYNCYYLYLLTYYFTDPRPLEAERMKAICIQWARYYLKFKNETLSV
ncbi:hypothetical protein HKD37_16G045502 [Glycine soja]